MVDTHTLIWWFTNSPRMGRNAGAALADSANERFVSSATGWELATKYRLGKLPEIEAVLPTLEFDLQRSGFATLDVTMRHALRAGALPGEHRDPFDRLIAAQAEIEGMTIVTLDSALRAFGVPTLW